MLASDLQNPEFVGSTNPDALMHVEFYWHEPIDKWASEEASMKQQRRVIVKGPKQVFVRIMRPGDKDNILEVPVREDHKQRWPDKWLYFQISEGLVDGGMNAIGWKLEDWPYLDDQQELLRDLKFNRFWTVEQVAGANDHQVQKLGIGGPGLREQARLALREKMRKEFAADLQEKEQTIAKQGQALAELQKQMQELLAAKTATVEITPAPEVQPEKKKGGRPKGSKNKPKVDSGEQHAS